MLDDGWEDGAGERRAEVTPPEAAATEVAAAVKGVRGDIGTPAAGLNGEKGSVPWEAAAAWAAAAAAAADPAAAAAAAEGDHG